MNFKKIKHNIRKKGLQRIADVVGYLLPLLSSIPPTSLYIGLMAIPFIMYIIVLLLNPLNIPPALFNLFIGQPLYSLGLIGGIALLVYSIVILRQNKTEGLVTIGPYQFIRHPQYVAMMSIVTVTTARSYVISSITRGISWIQPVNMIILWGGILCVYVALAGIEEIHLSNTFEKEYTKYIRRTGFFIPLYKVHVRSIDVLSSIAFLILYLHVSIVVELWSFGY